MGHEQRGSRPFLGDLLDALAETIDVRIQVLIQRLELTATMRSMRRQRQRREQRLTLAIPQRVAPPNAVRHRDRVQRVLHARAHPNPLMAVQEERTQIAKLGRRHPDRRKPIFRQQPQQQRRIATIVLLPA